MAEVFQFLLNFATQMLNYSQHISELCTLLVEDLYGELSSVCFLVALPSNIALDLLALSSLFAMKVTSDSSLARLLHPRQTWSPPDSRPPQGLRFLRARTQAWTGGPHPAAPRAPPH